MLLITSKFALLFLFFLPKIQSKYQVYTYDNGTNSDSTEQCCLVRIDDKFCLAQPLTRSFVQVRKECQRLNINDNTKNYLKNIVRRLNVETNAKVDEKILLELLNPIEQNILDNDLLCLSPTDTNNINLDKCFVQVQPKQSKVKNRKKSTKKNQTETVEDQSVESESIQQIEVNEPIEIHQGHGLSVRQTYELNLTNFQAIDHLQRQCWSWYRQNTKTILDHPTKTTAKCLSLSSQNEKCLNLLFHRKYSDAQALVVEKNSKLFCQTTSQQTKLIGYNYLGNICFTTHYEAYVEYKFTDFVSLSDRNQNQDVLEYISKNTKLTNEFETDCHDKNTLANLKKSIDEAEEQPPPAQVDSHPQEL